MQYLKFSTVIVLLFIFSLLSLGHSPDKITADFNLTEKVIEIEVYHSVEDKAKHYVDKVEIEHNGEVIITQQFKTQTSTSIQKLTYKIIDVGVEDKLTINAYCSIHGKISVEFKIETDGIIPVDEEKDQGDEDKHDHDHDHEH